MSVVVGDARAIPLPDASVQCVVTSPPYYGLRDYGVGGQIGSEGSLTDFLATMVGVMREVRRVLRDDGSVWLNMGDSFASAWGCRRRNVIGSGSPPLSERANPLTQGIREKCKMLVPHRLAIALCDDGWIVRQDIVWAKPNPMPESTRDRPTTAHEFVFLLAKSPRYYYDAEALREQDTGRPSGNGYKREHRLSYAGRGADEQWVGGAGRNKRSVWHIPSHPFPDAHFATFPPKLVEPCIKAGTPQKACPTCGTGWVRAVATTGGSTGKTWHGHADDARKGQRKEVRDSDGAGFYATYRRTALGFEPACDCPDNDGSGRARVLDPFAGSGTTGVVARQMGREFFGVELNPEYAAMANARIRSEGEGRTRTTDGNGRVSEQLVLGL